MRKQLFLLFAALLPLLASAQNKVEIDGIWYYLEDNTKQAAVTKSIGAKYPHSITIPDKVIYNDIEYRVTSIGDFAFSNCGRLKVVTIPEGVTSIGDNAFASCHNLTAITIPESVTSIGRAAFQYCTSLTTINISKGLKRIGGDAFRHCSRLTTITIPESVTRIGNYAFKNCPNLTDVTIGVTNIGTHAFSGKKYKEFFKPYFSIGAASSYNIYHYYYYDEGYYHGVKHSLGINLSGECHFTPYLGVRLTFDGLPCVVGLDGMLDVSTLFAGYTSHRRLDVALAYGCVVGKFVSGIQGALPIQYHINKNWGISLEWRSIILDDLSQSIQVGVKYNFK